MSSLHEKCVFAGCTTKAGNMSDYCAGHYAVAYSCVIDGCDNRVAAHSKSRCCRDHRREGDMRLRKKLKPWQR